MQTITQAADAMSTADTYNIGHDPVVTAAHLELVRRAEAIRRRQIATARRVTRSMGAGPVELAIMAKISA